MEAAVVVILACLQSTGVCAFPVLTPPSSREVCNQVAQPAARDWLADHPGYEIKMVTCADLGRLLSLLGTEV